MTVLERLREAWKNYLVKNHRERIRLLISKLSRISWGVGDLELIMLKDGRYWQLMPKPSDNKGQGSQGVDKAPTGL